MLERQAPRRRWRRRLLRFALGPAVVFALVFAALVGGRVYFDDARLRTLVLAEAQARLPSAVALDDLRLTLLSGIELRGLRIGPPPGFSKDVLRVGRLAIAWSAQELLAARLTLPEVALEDVYTSLEEDADGRQNLTVVLAALAGPEEPEPAAPEPTDEDLATTLSTFELPVHVVAPDVHVRDLAVEWSTPARSASLDHVGLRAAFEGQGGALDLTAWAGLGAEGAPAHLHFQQDIAPAVRLDSDARMDIDVRTRGLGDVAIVVGLDASLRAAMGEALPPSRLVVNLRTGVDLLHQKAQVEALEVSVGDGTRLELAAAAEGFLGTPAASRLRLEGLSLRSRLAELSPWLPPFVPGVTVAGELQVTAAPLSTTLAEVGAPADLAATLAATAQITLTDVALRSPQGNVDGLRIGLDVEVAGGIASVKGVVAARSGEASGQRLRGLAIDLEAKTVLAPFVASRAFVAADRADADMTLRLTSAAGGSADAAWHAEALRLRLRADAPVELLLAGRARESAHVDLRLHTGDAGGGPAQVSTADLTLVATARDLGGADVEAQLHLDLGPGTLAAEDEALRLPGLVLDASAGARGDTYDVEHLTLGLGELVQLRLAGRVVQALGPRPRCDAVALDVAATDLAAVWSLAPAKLQKELTPSGGVRLHLRVDGVVPHAELAAAAQPPVIEWRDDEESQRRVVAAYVDWVEGWSARLRAGLPLRAAVELDLEDVGLVAGTTRFDGLRLHFGLTVEEHALQLELTSTLARADLPPASQAISLRQVSLHHTFAFAEGTSRVRLESSVGSAEVAALTRPLVGAKVDLDLSYTLGGDLRLDTFALSAPDRHALVSLAGVVTKPVRMALQNGLGRVGLPGLEAAVRWHLAFASPELDMPAHGAPRLQGGVSLDGSLGVDDGILRLAGGLRCEHLSLRLEGAPSEIRSADADSGADANADPATQAAAAPPPLVLEDLDGELPFDVRLAFRPDEMATVLPITLPFGGGAVGLVTSAADIRSQPARPTAYDRLLPYRQRRALSIARIARGDLQVTNLELDASVKDGILAADRIGLSILGGDVLGEMAMQLSRQAEVIAHLTLKTSNVDVSNFATLKLAPGPDSELSADVSLSFLFGPRSRDLALSMNVTKIGEKSFDRVLQMLSNNGKDEKIDGYRSQLGLVHIDQVAVWVRFENLNIDLDYGTVVPGYRPIPHDMLRRYSLSGILDLHLQPLVDLHLGPLWSRTRGRDDGDG